MLRNSPATTVADRKEIIRCLLDRVVVSIQKNTEYVDLTLNWAGGFVSQHQVVRSLAQYDKLRDYDRLVLRLRELRSTGIMHAEISECLNKRRLSCGQRAFEIRQKDGAAIAATFGPASKLDQ